MKLIIGSLVGAIILFVWSAISWTVSPIHAHTFQYTPAQDSVLKALALVDQSGAYMLPAADNNAPDFQKHENDVRMANIGKPVAMLFLNKQQYEMGGSTFLMGFLCNWVTALLLCTLVTIAGGNTLSFGRRWAIAMIPGLIIIYAVWLVQWNWMGFPWSYLSGSVIDSLLEFAACGAWIGWWFGRTKKS